MKKSRPELILLLLLTTVFWLEANVIITIRFVNEQRSRDEARQFCQKNYVDMVTWNTDLLTDWLQSQGFGYVWIGLHEDPEQEWVWKWINVRTGEGLTGDDVSRSENWGKGHPYDNSCGYYRSCDRKWYSTYCSQRFFFICYEDNLVLVTENKIWEEALNHCRQMTTATHKYDLFSFATSSHFSYGRDRIYKATTGEVWTGFRFLGGEWLWADGETLDHQEMLPDCPSQWKHCGTLSKDGTANWTTSDYSEKLHLLLEKHFLRRKHDALFTLLLYVLNLHSNHCSLHLKICPVLG